MVLRDPSWQSQGTYWELGSNLDQAYRQHLSYCAISLAPKIVLLAVSGSTRADSLLDAQGQYEMPGI